MYVKLVVLLLLLIHIVFSNKPTLEKTWAVQLEGGREEAQRIAQRTGVTLVKQILGNYYLFKENNNVRRARLMDKDSERRLKAEHSVKMVKEQLPHTRELYVHEEGHRGVVFNDQMWGSQTYLHTGAVHMNILPAWERTRKGEGVVVGVIDDGIFTNQPDLRDNLAAGLSYNVLQETTDPTPSFQQASHGTNCAGIIAAVHNNSFCGVGVAYKAKVAGIKMFAGAQAELSDAQEASALSHQYQSISVYSCSWGPSDWNNALEGPDTVAKEALVMAAREGRDGKGSVFVFSTGNGGSLNDSCAYNGYVNTNNTIGIGGLLQDGSIPSFAEACTSVFAVTLSRDYTGDTANMVVPHRATGCGTTFSGTSPAAAMAAGVFTLALSANDQLSVRDVQHLVTRTSTNTVVCGQTWKENSAGFRVSDYCGFGLLDAGKLTAMAANWSCVPEQVSCTQQREGASINIPQSGEVLTSITVQQDSCGVNYLEHVLLTVRVTFPHRGHLQFRLTSPGGTVSDIVPGRAPDLEPDLEWTFMTVHHWGERAEGSWQLSIRNTHPHLSNTGILEGWSLVFLGTATDPVNSSTSTASTPGTDTTPRSVKTSSPSSEVFTRKSTSSTLAAQTTQDQTTQPMTTKTHTTQPSTTKSHTTQPTTAKLRTTQPTTTKLRTTQPTTTKLRTTQPSTTKLHTTQPSTIKLHTTQPSTTKLHTTQPSTTKLHTTQPSTTKLHTSTTKLHTTQPSTTKLHTTTTKLHTTQPSTTKLHTSTTKLHTTQPSTTKLHTTQPSTTKLHTSTTKLHTTQPATTKSHTTQPSTTKSHTTQPSTTKLHTTQPSTTKVYTTQPATTKSHTKPSTTKSHTTQPSTTKSHTTQPSTTYTTQPSTKKLHTTQPSTTKSHTTQPSTTKLHTTQPSTTKAHTTQPTTTKVHTTQPTTTNLHTTQPSTTKSHTTQPTTTTLHTTQPSTTKSHTTQTSTTKLHTTQPKTTKAFTMQPTTKSHTTQPTNTKTRTMQQATTRARTTQTTTTKMQMAHTKFITTKTQTEPAQGGNLDTLLPGINTKASAGIISCICILILVIAAVSFAIWHCRRYKHNSCRVENRNIPVLQAPLSKVSSHSSRHRSPQVSSLYSSEQGSPKEPDLQLDSHRYRVGNEEVQITFI
ncbi:uncharacterized protein LOC144924826 isoform X2 [Branchiostoma floridae x Branchiostoma belcheri]